MSRPPVVLVEYLPSEQFPVIAGAKLSILDVRCKDRTGTSFLVEMQLIHVPGFVNLLRLLARAKIMLTEEDRAHIAACTDAATLDPRSGNCRAASGARASSMSIATGNSS